MKIDESILNAIPQEQRQRFAGFVAEIVCESFIFTGDRDYLTARFAFFEKQSHLFLWSAAQAIEKYLKANILFLGSGCVSRTHHHTKLATALRGSHPERLKIDLTIPLGWEEQGISLWHPLSVDSFLERIEILGSPDVRYDQVPLDVQLQDLIYLDRLAFSLRHRLVLERVRDCRLVGNRLKSCFWDLNYSFAPADHEHPPLDGMTLAHVSVSTLEAALNGCYGYADLYKVWSQRGMGLKPRDVDLLDRKET